MKFLSTLLLIVFISFQISPIITILVDNSYEKNFNLDLQDEEEENTKLSKKTIEIKSGFVYNNNLAFLNTNSETINNPSFYLIKKYKVATTITIIPPELI